MTDKHNVRKGKEITFADDEVRIIRPLTIKLLRKYVKVINSIEEKDISDLNSISDEDLDLMIDAAAIILEKVDPALANDRERLEDALDLGIFNEMMTVAMGAASPEE